MNKNRRANYQPASVSKRLLAIIYDLILLAALLMIASAIALVINHNQPIASGNLLMLLWLLIIGFLYYGVSWKISGQTLGLKTWHLQVISFSHQPLTWQVVIVRYFLAAILFCTIIGFIWIWFNKRRLTAYDILTKTKIVRVDS